MIPGLGWLFSGLSLVDRVYRNYIQTQDVVFGAVSKALWYEDGRTGEELCIELDFELKNPAETPTTVTYVGLINPDSRLPPRLAYLRSGPDTIVSLDVDQRTIDGQDVEGFESWTYFSDPQDGTFTPRGDLDALLYVETDEGRTFHEIDVAFLDPS